MNDASRSGHDRGDGGATPAFPHFLSGGGEAGALMRAHDWSNSPLGPPEAWPQPLRTLAGVMLGSDQPMFVAWGPARGMLYNDGYAALLGKRHPGALGRPFDEVWFDILGDVGPIMDRAYAGLSTHMDDLRLVMHRHGYPEEAHFAFSYTPVRDEAGRVAGMFCACAETTGKVQAERALRESEARQAFRAELGEHLRTLTGAREIMATAAALLGRRLGAAQVGYAEVDAQGYAASEAEFTDGRMPNLPAGRYRLDDFGPRMADELRAGRIVAIDDVGRDERTFPPACWPPTPRSPCAPSSPSRSSRAGA